MIFPFYKQRKMSGCLSRHFENKALNKERPVRKTAWISLVCHMPMTIFKTDDEVAAPGRTLQCTELFGRGS